MCLTYLDDAHLAFYKPLFPDHRKRKLEIITILKDILFHTSPNIWFRSFQCIVQKEISNPTIPIQYNKLDDINGSNSKNKLVVLYLHMAKDI